METFGERLQQARKKKKLTQEELANKVGMGSKRAVSMWENDNSKPETDTLLIVSQVLEVSLDWLLTGVRTYTDENGKITIAVEEYVEYLKLKNEKLQQENTSLKNPKPVPISQ